MMSRHDMSKGDDMTKKKYEITDERGDSRLRRIRALRDIPVAGVRAGDLGGWIEHEGNLAQGDVGGGRGGGGRAMTARHMRKAAIIAKTVIGPVVFLAVLGLICLAMVAGINRDAAERAAYDEQCIAAGGVPAHGVLGDRCDR